MIIIALPAPKKSWLENNIISAVRWKFDQYAKKKRCLFSRGPGLLS